MRYSFCHLDYDFGWMSRERESTVLSVLRTSVLETIYVNFKILKKIKMDLHVSTKLVDSLLIFIPSSLFEN